MISREVFEDMVSGAYYELVKVDNPQAGKKFGWYLRDTDNATEYLPNFCLDKAEPPEIARLRANEHCRHLGYRLTRIAK